MKMMRKFNYDGVLRITEKISEYMNKTESKIYEIENMLKGVINESFNTKS